eukprot:SAG11_NODE_18112_length_499_cov_2.150000_1_plen_52_part_01
MAGVCRKDYPWHELLPHRSGSAPNRAEPYRTVPNRESVQGRTVEKSCFPQKK